MLNSCTYQYPQFWVSEKQDFPLPRTQSTTLIVFCNIFVLDCCSWSQPFLVLVIRIQSPSWMSHMLRLPSSHYIVQTAKAPQQIPLHFEYRELNTSLNPPEKGWKSFFFFMAPSWVWWIFQQASASILSATRWVWGTEIFLQNLQPKSQSTDRPGEFVCMIGVKIPEPWTGIRRDSSGLKATELCYSGTSKSRQARGWDQGTPGSELSFPDYTDRSSSASQGQQEPVAGIPPGNQDFCFPLRELQKYKEI